MPKPNTQVPYTYLFIRDDLPPEVQLVQASHAALEIGLRCEPTEQTSFLIALRAKNELRLENIAAWLLEQDIKHHMFYEPDYETGYTAICTEPIYGEDRNKFRKFQLYKGSKQ